MPMSRDQAREILRRLTRHGTIEDLARRLATRLPTARECLRILRCEGSEEGHEVGSKFAEIAAAIPLAGEISIVGAICASEFATAHERMRRPAGPR